MNKDLSPVFHVNKNLNKDLRPCFTFIYRLLIVFIIGFWIVMMGLLIYKEFLPKSITSQRINLPQKFPYKGRWGVYSNEKRIGFFETEIVMGADGYIWKNYADIKFLDEIRILMDVIVFLDAGKKLDNFKLNISYGENEINLSGIVKDDVLKIDDTCLAGPRLRSEASRQASGQLNYSIPWGKNASVIDNGIIPLVFLPGLKVGEKLNWYIFNPLTQSRELVKAIVRRSSFYYNKKDFVPVIILDMYYQNMNLNFWIDSEGNPLKVNTSWGWELAAE